MEEEHDVHFFKKPNGEYDWIATIQWQAMLRVPGYKETLFEKYKKDKIKLETNVS